MAHSPKLAYELKHDFPPLIFIGFRMEFLMLIFGCLKFQNSKSIDVEEWMFGISYDLGGKKVDQFASLPWHSPCFRLQVGLCRVSAGGAAAWGVQKPCLPKWKMNLVFRETNYTPTKRVHEILVGGCAT